MKNLYSHILFAFIFTFLGTQFSFAQDSNAIKELRQKLKEAKDEKSRVNAKIELYNQFGRESKQDSALVYGFQLIDFFKKEKKFQNVGELYMSINTNYLLQGDKANADKYRLEAQKYLEKTNNADDYVMVELSKAQELTLKNKYIEAGDILEQVIQSERNKSIKVSPQRMLNAFSMSLSNYMLRNKLSDSYKRALDFYDYTTKYDKANSFIPMYYIGYLQYKMKNASKAIESLKKCEELLPQKNTPFLSEINIVRSFSYLELKDYTKAKEAASKALSQSESLGLNQNLGRIYYIFSNIYQKEKDYKKAMDYAKKAFDLSPENDIYQIKTGSKQLMLVVEVDAIQDGSITFANDGEKKERLNSLRSELDANYKDILSKQMFHNDDVEAQSYEGYYKIDEMLGDYKSAFDYYKKYKELENRSTSAENIRGVEQVQSDRDLSEQRLKIKFEEETKRIQLQKELELKALRYEFDKKQAAAKTEEERQRLLLEEEHKRREISIKYDEEQKAVALKYAQEKKVAKAEQEKKDAEAKAELSKSKNIRNMSIGGAVTALLLLGFAGWSYNQKRKDGIKIAAEKKKSEDLLLNILPQEVAQELKEKGKSDAKYYDEVSVLFTDFVNFTTTSEKIGVQELLEELNVCFTEFDNIMGRHGLEKIKTIGDAYLAVSGLPTVNKDHAKNAIAASQEILKFIEERKKVSPNALDLRIGIHSGHVIAGIVGVKKFAYDIWGDTVNTAARMEQAGEKGKINISKNTYELVKDDFQTTCRGKISVKGKGEQEMYFVEA